MRNPPGAHRTSIAPVTQSGIQSGVRPSQACSPVRLNISGEYIGDKYGPNV